MRNKILNRKLMKINRHNYEEYFILYLDNELSSEERLMVEAFVQQHSDLRDELQLLAQFKLKPDEEVVFAHKEQLFFAKETAENELQPEMNSALLLYLDNELSPAQKNELETAMKNNPLLKKEWDLLLRTRLQPEQIVCSFKDTLYKTEKPVRQFWVKWRYAAAAILLLAMAVSAIVVFTGNKKASDNPVVKTNQQDRKPNEVVQDNNKVKVESFTQPENIVQPEVVKEEALVKEIKPVAPTIISKNSNDNKNEMVKQAAKIEKQLPVPDLEKPEETIAINQNRNSNNLPLPENNPYLRTDIKKTDISTTAFNKPEPDPEAMIPKTNKVTNTIAASYNNNPAIVDEQESGKDNKKSRGLFRKILRTVVKRTNAVTNDDENDDKLLIGGFAIRLK